MYRKIKITFHCIVKVAPRLQRSMTRHMRTETPLRIKTLQHLNMKAHTPLPQHHVSTAPPNAFDCNCKVLEMLTTLKINWCSVIFSFNPQPSPVKKERSPRPQSFCHSSSVSPQEKLTLPGYLGHRDKQRLSYGAFANPVYSTSTETPASPVSEGPTIASKTPAKGKMPLKSVCMDLMVKRATW